MEWTFVWAASVMLGTAWAALSGRTKWQVGLVSTLLFGPLGLGLVALDVATYRRSVQP